MIFLLCTLFILGCFIFLYGCVCRSDDAAHGGLLLILAVIACLIFIVPDIISAHIEFDYIKEKYYNLERQINTIEYDDIVTDKNLRNQVLEMNNIISEHKVKSKNVWVDAWYSEEIGKLKPLEWKSKKYNTTEK